MQATFHFIVFSGFPAEGALVLPRLKPAFKSYYFFEGNASNLEKVYTFLENAENADKLCFLGFRFS